MITIQRYFLYILMFNSFCLSAMEHVDRAEWIDVKDRVDIDKLALDTQAKLMRDIIDRDHLGIGACECGHLRSLLGSIVSFIKPCLLTHTQIADEMGKIVGHIPQGMNKKAVLQKLIKKHWYVRYLMDYLVQQKIDALTNVTVSNIHTMYDDYVNENESDVVKIMVRDDVSAILFADTYPTTIDLLDIHFTTLRADGGIRSHSLSLSSDDKYVPDDKYVKATSGNNERLVWDMKTAQLVNAQQVTGVNWIKPNKSSSESIKYKAIIFESGMFLFAHPQIASHLCQQAFENSNTKSELTALKDSKIAGEIEGFVRDNLNKVIENKILLLTDHRFLKRSTR